MKNTRLQSARTSLASLIAFLMLLSSTAHAAESGVDPDADYDRLDGKGTSGKKVDVIEWGENLEIHVYPAGSLKGLSLKLDKKNKDRPVMVIGYRFTDNKSDRLIRRAILGIPFAEGFRAFRDPSADDYDKIIVTNQGMSKQVAEFKLDAAPDQLYPDGHPALQAAGAPAPTKVIVIVKDTSAKKGVTAVSRAPTSEVRAVSKDKVQAQADEDGADTSAAPDTLNDDGAIRPFKW